MVKSGKFTVGPGNVFGRLGSGIGKGLAEQLPKEIDRGRLASGLQQFEKEAPNLSPLQQASRLFSIPGITPQMVQVLPELLRQQNLRNAYSNKKSDQIQKSNPSVSASISQIQPGGLSSQGNAPRNISQQNEFVEPEEFGQPQIVQTNPLVEEALPRVPWSPERRDDEIARVWDDRPNLTLPEVINIAADNERRYLEAPKAVQEQIDYRRQQQDLANKSFDDQLQTKLQKNKEGVFQDITGENLINLKRSMYKDLATNPNATIEDVVNKWTNKALDLSKSKKLVDEIANRSIWDKLTKSDQILDKLKSAQKIYSETGNQEEYYNTLRSNFDLSPQGAASIAFPLSPGLNSYINKIKPISTSEYKGFDPTYSRKYATDIENMITRDDSLLAIARALHLKDPTFDQRTFFSQLRENQENLGLTPRQKRELVQGEAAYLPSWGDILLLPVLRGK